MGTTDAMKTMTMASLQSTSRLSVTRVGVKSHSMDPFCIIVSFHNAKQPISVHSFSSQKACNKCFALIVYNDHRPNDKCQNFLCISVHSFQLIVIIFQNKTIEHQSSPQFLAPGNLSLVSVTNVRNLSTRLIVPTSWRCGSSSRSPRMDSRNS
jgi:hypothetical protein